MEVHMNKGQATAVFKLLVDRVRVLDQTECNNDMVREEMRVERLHLVAVIGEIALEALGELP